MTTETEREAEVTKQRLKTEGATLVTVVSLWVAMFMAPSWFARVLVLAAWAAVILFRLVTSRLELSILLAARAERQRGISRLEAARDLDPLRDPRVH